MSAHEKQTAQGTVIGSTVADWLRRMTLRREARMAERDPLLEQVDVERAIGVAAASDLLPDGIPRPARTISDRTKTPDMHPKLLEAGYTPMPPGQPYAEAVRYGRVVVGEAALPVLFDRNGQPRR